MKRRGRERAARLGPHLEVTRPLSLRGRDRVVAGGEDRVVARRRVGETATDIEDPPLDAWNAADLVARLDPGAERLDVLHLVERAVVHADADRTRA
ncbi:MAG TPA: hypothetical protein PKA58_26740, partial [Polyangium sp.]|nr:hypothetical protein [Polyangium sp.]